MSIQTLVEYIDSMRSPHEKYSKLGWEQRMMLSDQYSFSDEHWLFNLEEIEEFANKIIHLYEDSPRGISFSATWSPDMTNEVRELSIDELSNRYLNNRLQRQTKYIVRKPIDIT